MLVFGFLVEFTLMAYVDYLRFIFVRKQMLNVIVYCYFTFVTKVFSLKGEKVGKFTCFFAQNIRDFAKKTSFFLFKNV